MADTDTVAPVSTNEPALPTCGSRSSASIVCRCVLGSNRVSTRSPVPRNSRSYGSPFQTSWPPATSNRRTAMPEIGDRPEARPRIAGPSSVIVTSRTGSCRLSDSSTVTPPSSDRQPSVAVARGTDSRGSAAGSSPVRSSRPLISNARRESPERISSIETVPPNDCSSIAIALWRTPSRNQSLRIVASKPPQPSPKHVVAARAILCRRIDVSAAWIIARPQRARTPGSRCGSRPAVP